MVAAYLTSDKSVDLRTFTEFRHLPLEYFKTLLTLIHNGISHNMRFVAR